MKQIAWILVFGMVLSPACLAETSSADRFLSNLSDTWDSFLDMTGDAWQDVTDWAEESGVADWVEGATQSASEWARENGLTDWANDALQSIGAWYQASGISEWSAEASQRIQVYIEENRPAIEAWLAEAGQEVREAWNTLVNPDRHTKAELEKAYETVTESLEEIGG